MLITITHSVSILSNTGDYMWERAHAPFSQYSFGIPLFCMQDTFARATHSAYAAVRPSAAHDDRVSCIQTFIQPLGQARASKGILHTIACMQDTFACARTRSKGVCDDRVSCIQLTRALGLKAEQSKSSARRLGILRCIQSMVLIHLYI